MTLEDLCGQAVAFHQRGEQSEAERLYGQVIAAEPGHFTACHLLGIMRFQQGRHEEALTLIGVALQTNPADAEAHSNRGNVLKALGRPEEALASYDAALALEPDYAQAFYNRALTLSQLGRFEDALASYDAALAADPCFAMAANNRGSELRRLRRPEEALASYDAALAIDPDYVDALNNRGVILRDLKRHAEALASFDRALTLRPDNAAALYNRANALSDLDRLQEAFGDYVRALGAEPGHPHARDGAASAALRLCDWPRAATIAGLLRAQVAGGTSITTPFTLLGYSDDAALLRRCAEQYVDATLPPQPPLWQGTRYRHDRIRIAYLSADFRIHATAQLMAGLFERHDRARFEVHAISFGPDEDSAMRARLVKGFDRFHDATARGDDEVARRLRELEVDIVIDLNGHTNGSRPEILSRRPAPVQVNYLGYPGTMGADFIDYVIADPVVLPLAQQEFFREKIVHLPDCYQVNDSARPIGARTLSRQEAGLPENAFVFCSFNNSWKITPPLFDIWMRLLARLPGSVLWLIQGNDGAIARLRAEAAARGVDPRWLVFAGRVEPEAHLARHRLADLFLDTLPVGAHTTASDALWAGLPLVTCTGKSFAGRVAASLLHAIGLPELATENLQDYEALALKLAADPGLLAAIREKLARNRLTTPLFDTDGFRRNIEAAYVRMWEIAEAGEAPRSFAV